MIEALVLAGGLAAGVDRRLLLLAAGAVWAPIPSVVALGGALIVGRRAEARAASGAEVRFVESVIGELRAGASMRAALLVACADRPGAERIVRRLRVGEPLSVAVSGIGQLLPSVGHLVETAIVTGGSGGRMLPVFDELLVHAVAEEETAAELRTAVAPVRASMLVLVGAPVAYLVWSGITGRLMRLLSLPGGMWMAAIGSTLFVTGIATMVALARAGR